MRKFLFTILLLILCVLYPLSSVIFLYFFLLCADNAIARTTLSNGIPALIATLLSAVVCIIVAYYIDKIYHKLGKKREKREKFSGISQKKN